MPCRFECGGLMKTLVSCSSLRKTNDDSVMENDNLLIASRQIRESHKFEGICCCLRRLTSHDFRVILPSVILTWK